MPSERSLNIRTTTIRLPTRLLLLLLITPLALAAQERAPDERRPKGHTSEFIGRSWATKQVLPTYPAAAIARNLQGVVEAGVGITDEGRVIKVRVPPGLDPLLRQATVAAVKLWEFRPAVNKLGPGEYDIFRLTFNFVIEDGVGRVELYNPPYETPQHRRMRGAQDRDITEWLKWEDATADN